MKHNFSFLLAFFLVAITFLFKMNIHTQAVESGQSNWDRPTFVYGGGLSQSELSETRGLLNVDEGQMKEVEISGTDVDKYLGTSGSSTSALISSVLVERTAEGSGVSINIKTPDNITVITEQQYTNAAITAGVENVSIDVASIRPATGESALTGVYKAFESNGETLDEDRMQVAQDELGVTSDIEEGMDEKQSVQFNQVIVNIKQTINNYYDEHSEAPSADEIRQIVEESLDKYELNNIVNGDQINNLVMLFEDYADTDAINSEAVKEQLNKLNDRLGDIWKDVQDSGILERIWQAIVDFFSNIAALFR